MSRYGPRAAGPRRRSLTPPASRASCARWRRRWGSGGGFFDSGISRTRSTWSSPFLQGGARQKKKKKKKKPARRRRAGTGARRRARRCPGAGTRPRARPRRPSCRGSRARASFTSMARSSSVKPGDGHRDAVGVLARALDVVGRVALGRVDARELGRGWRTGGSKPTVLRVRAGEEIEVNAWHILSLKRHPSHRRSRSARLGRTGFVRAAVEAGADPRWEARAWRQEGVRALSARPSARLCPLASRPPIA